MRGFSLPPFFEDFLGSTAGASAAPFFALAAAALDEEELFAEAGAAALAGAGAGAEGFFGALAAEGLAGAGLVGATLSFEIIFFEGTDLATVLLG